MKYIIILIFAGFIIPRLDAQEPHDEPHEVHNDDNHPHTKLDYDKGRTVEGKSNPDRTNKPGKDQKDFPNPNDKSRSVPNRQSPANVSRISLEGAQRLKKLTEFMQLLATIQTLRILKEFLEAPSLGTFDRLRKIANNDIKEMLEELAKMPKQERDIANKIVDDIKNELALSMDQPPVSNDMEMRDQTVKEYEFWNKFEDGLNFIPAKSKQSSLMMIKADFGVVASMSSTHNTITMLSRPLMMRLKESDTEGLQALSPNMENISDILIYPIFSLANVPCWGVDLTVNVYASVYKHDPENQAYFPIPFEDIESKGNFKLLGSYKVPGLSIAHSQFLLTKNSGLFLPDFFYSGFSPNSFYITLDNANFQETDGIFDFYFYYTLTVDNVTSAPSPVDKIIHRL
jgi:hypothetical protein